MPDAAGQTHDVTLGGIGLLTVPNTLRRYDITPFAPQVRNNDPRYRDFSISQFWVMKSWHHGRASFDWEDPDSFYDSANIWTHVPGQATLAGLQNIVSTGVTGIPLFWRLITTSATLYVATASQGTSARGFFSFNNATPDWTSIATGMTVDPTDFIEFRGNLFVGQGMTTAYRTNSSGSWAAGAVAAAIFTKFNEMVLYRAAAQNEVYWTTVANPGSGDWSGPIYVGDTNTAIRSMIVFDNRIYVGKDDGLYIIQDGRAFQLYDFQWARDPNNFLNMKAWQGALYFPIMHGLYRLLGGTLQAVGPERGTVGGMPTFRSLSPSGTAAASQKRGYIVDLIPAGEWLFAVVDSGLGQATAGISQILAFNNSGWHQIVEAAAGGANNRIRSAFFTSRLATTSTLNNPRLWFGYGTGANSAEARNVIFPWGTEDPFEYGDQTYFAGTGTTAQLVTPWFDAGLANVWKEFQKVSLYSEGLTTAETVQVAFEVDQLGAYQDLLDSSATSLAFTVSPYQEINFPRNTIGKRVRLRLSLVRGATTTLTPKMRTVVVAFVPRPDTKYAWQATGRLGRRMRNPYTGRYEARDPAEWMQLLSELRDRRTRIEWDDGDVEPGITNLVLNPVFQIDTDANGVADNWNLVTLASGILVQRNKLYGIRSQELAYADWGGVNDGVFEGLETDAMTTVAGSRYTASIWVYIALAWTNLFTVQIRSAGATLESTSVVLPTATWTRLEVTAVATGTSTTMRVGRVNSPASVTRRVFLDAAQFELTPDARFANFQNKATSFCSGEQPHCQWTGRAHLSTSTRRALYDVFVSNIQRVELSRPSIADRLRGRGIETRVTFTVVETGTVLTPT